MVTVAEDGAFGAGLREENFKNLVGRGRERGSKG